MNKLFSSIFSLIKKNLSKSLYKILQFLISQSTYDYIYEKNVNT